MTFKIKKILTERQLKRAKFSLFLAGICVIFSFGTIGAGELDYDSDAQANLKEMMGEDADATFQFPYYDAKAKTGTFKKWEVVRYPRGKIVYLSSNEVICRSPLLIPGVAILPNGLLAVFYGLCLFYLFLGIGIVSDLFMAGIERITSSTKIYNVLNDQGEVVKTKKVMVWNPTVANLTLMALGSSAPEILLSCIETSGGLGGCPGELGASTIVGSAAFNLLVISAVSIYAVNEKNDDSPDRDDSVPAGVKKIYDMGVFTVTAFSSIFAYVWMWIVLLDQSVSPIEAWLTFLFFFILIGSAYGMDKYKAVQVEKEKLIKGEKDQDDAPVIAHTAVEIYRELINEKSGVAAIDEAQLKKRAEMKKFLEETMKTDQIDKVNIDDLKKAIDGEGMISRMKYRRQVGALMSGKKQVVAKGEIIKLEHVQAENIDASEKNELFGFKCLHYSVSEASGSLRIHVLNKSRRAGQVRVVTEDQEAIAGDDYEAVDRILSFSEGETSQYIEVTINDDDNWEPDEDFFVQLKDPQTGENLKGKDCRTRVTIIDDDKPGQICFEETKGIKALASEEYCNIVLNRKNGSDGVVTVDYKTVQLDKSDHTATPGIDYEEAHDTVTFEQGMSTATIKIRIIQKPDNEPRDEFFGIQLENIKPEGAKLSKKSFQIINIVTDIEGKKKQEALAQLMQKIEDEEEATWSHQFIQACMLHPTKNEEGVIEDISALDGFLHFATIGWKIFFAFIPPPHYLGGWACFVISLCFIGFVTYIVGQFADLFGCVLNIKPAVTAITFVALGTSLPDTFASMAAASAEKYADAAVGNVTGSNSVNVFLGLGLPWVIAVLWEGGNDPGVKGYDPIKISEKLRLQTGDSSIVWGKGNYYVPAGSLGFSVAVFCFCAILCIITLLVRRRFVGGELGGSNAGRLGSMLLLVSLWLLYIVMSIFQAYGLFGLEELTMGIKMGVYNPNCDCNLKASARALCLAAPPAQ